jgi:uncharacterized protein (TIGR02217 family)
MTQFHDVRFPEDISFGSVGGIEFSTTVVTAYSGFEQRNINWEQARARYNVAYGVRTNAQLEALIAFFRARRGRAYAFRFKDWNDYQSAPVESAITPTDQDLGIGDGTRTTFQLQKTYVSGAVNFVRPVTRPVPGTVRVALMTSELTSGWSVDHATGRVTFATPPGSGVVVRAGFAFDVPVRFDVDTLLTALDAYGIGSVQRVGLIEVRE